MEYPTKILGIRNAVADAVHDPKTLKRNRSLMEDKRDRLLAIEGLVVAKFRKYWFPRLLIINWLGEVEKLKSETKKLAAEGSTLLQKVVHFVFPNKALISEVKEQCTKLDKAIQEGIKLEDDMEKRGTIRIVKHTTPVNIENINSLTQNLGKLLKHLEDVNTNSIRVYGDPGTGKRLLLQHLNNDEALVNMFDIVLWCDINENSTDTNIQLIIAKQLGLDVSNISDTNFIAMKIKEELEGAKYLLLLDDVKADIKLDTIGMPMNTNGSKIVYTTYLRFVQPFFPFVTMTIEKLKKPDSWQMFANILNDGNGENILQGEIEATSYKVVDICDGLFSLIIIVAKNFKQKRTVESWSEGLQKLRRPPHKDDTYMQAKKTIMHFSYDGLKDNQKLCFLFSILYPEDNQIPIDYLFDCWTTLKLVEFGVEEGSRETRREILEHLLEMALLNEGSSSRYVKIERILRKATIKILREQDWFKCLVAQEALEILKSGNCKDTHWISLNNSEIEDLNVELDCGNLTTLFLQKNSKLRTMSSSFFRKMNKLLILDLDKTKSELVLPMNDMQSLKVLYLNECVMLKEFHFNPEDCSHNLEVLDIRGRKSNEIPPQIKNFKALRRLMMSIHGSATLPSIICELSSLRELIIDVEPDVNISDKDAFITWCNRVIEKNIKQIATLTELSTLKFCFGDEIVDVIRVMGDTLKIFIPKQTSLQHIWKKGYNNYRELQVYIGFRMSPNLKVPKHFIKYDSFVLSSLKMVIKPEIKEVLSKVKAIIMMDSSTLENLDQTTMSHVYYCLVQRCNKIVTLINQTDGFSNLETLILSDCSLLEALFSDWVQTAMNIKHLEIRDCLVIKEINMSLESVGDILPKLETLVLHNLGMLEKICSKPDLEWPSLTTLEIHKCPMLKEIPLKGNNANNLHAIKVEKKWWEALQLDDEIKQKFEQHCEFSDMPVCQDAIA